jgi:16S rRNA (guanine527-N7)-methyltransferase
LNLDSLIPPNLVPDFEAFADRLYEANKVMNLTRVPREQCWERHFLDSLLFEDMIPQDAFVLDIGTGAGFPAWPLARVRPDLQVVALDSTSKILGFLAESPLPNLTLAHVRAEDFDARDSFDVVTGRAFAPLAIQLEVSVALAKVGGAVIPMRTENDLAEIQRVPADQLGLKLEDIVERMLAETKRLFPIYRKVKPTPKRYPRLWAEIKRKPL